MSDSQKRIRIDPLAQLVLELAALIDQDLAVLGEHDAIALERPWRRAFEVDTRRPEPAAVAWAFELRFGRQEVRRAAKVGACRVQHVEPARAMHDVVARPYDPDAVRLFVALVDAHTEV